MCRIDSADSVTELTSEHRKARKLHPCSECNRVIERGETYLYETHLFDGAVNTVKTCAHCQVCRQWLSKNCGGYIYGEVADEINEHWEEGYRMVGRLAAGLRRFWKKRTGALMPLPKMPIVPGAHL